MRAHAHVTPYIAAALPKKIASTCESLKAFEDPGYYCVDNLPVALISTFARLCQTSQEIFHAALVVDIRERGAWGQLLVHKDINR